MQVHRPPLENLRRFLTAYFRTLKERVDVDEVGDYYVIEFIDNIRNYLRRNIVNSLPAFVFNMMTERVKPRYYLKLRTIILLHKYYGSLEALCALYARRKYLRMNCTGRPGAIELAIQRYNPHTLATAYPPYEIRQCQGKKVISYATSMYSDVYLCRL